MLRFVSHRFFSGAGNTPDALSPSILHIVKLGDPGLWQKSEKLNPKLIKSVRMQAFFDSMLETMHHNNGIGLAAPQVGANVRVFCFRPVDREEFHRQQIQLLETKGHWSPSDTASKHMPLKSPEIVINPKLLTISIASETELEGCLSIPGLECAVRRPLALRLEYLDRWGTSQTQTFRELDARVVLHEFDHLNGILMLDRQRKRDEIYSNEYTKDDQTIAQILRKGDEEWRTEFYGTQEYGMSPEEYEEQWNGQEDEEEWWKRNDDKTGRNFVHFETEEQVEDNWPMHLQGYRTRLLNEYDEKKYKNDKSEEK